MVSAFETLQQVEAVCPPSPFRDALERFRKDIFLEMPDQTLGLFRRASLVFVDHFPKEEAEWESWHHRAAAMFKQAQNKWMAENNITPRPDKVSHQIEYRLNVKSPSHESIPPGAATLSDILVDGKSIKPKPIDLDEAERIGKAANPAPWFHDEDRSWSNGGIYAEVDENGNGVTGREVLAVCDEFMCGDAVNGEFVVYARNNWQAMVDELRILRGRSGHSIPWADDSALSNERFTKSEK